MTNFGKIIYDLAKGKIPSKYSEVSCDERQKAVVAEIYSELGIAEGSSEKQIKRALRDNEKVVFAIIEDTIDTVLANGEYTEDAFIKNLCEIKNLSLGDKNEFYVTGAKRLNLVEFSGNHTMIKRRRLDKSQSFQVDVKDQGLKVYEEFARLLSNRASMQDLINAIEEAVNRKIVELAKGGFVQAVANLPTEFTFNGAYDTDGILETIAHVEGANGTVPTIIGCRQAIRKLQDVDVLMSDNMKDEWNRNGRLSVWNGYNIVELPQGHKYGSLEFLFPTNKLYILTGGVKPVKVVLEGESLVSNVTANTGINVDLTEEHMVATKMGVGVCYDGVIGEITLV